MFKDIFDIMAQLYLIENAFIITLCIDDYHKKSLWNNCSQFFNTLLNKAMMCLYKISVIMAQLYLIGSAFIITPFLQRIENELSS